MNVFTFVLCFDDNTNIIKCDSLEKLDNQIDIIERLHGVKLLRAIDISKAIFAFDKDAVRNHKETYDVSDKRYRFLEKWSKIGLNAVHRK